MVPGPTPPAGSRLRPAGAQTKVNKTLSAGDTQQANPDDMHHVTDHPADTLSGCSPCRQVWPGPDGDGWPTWRRRSGASSTAESSTTTGPITCPHARNTCPGHVLPWLPRQQTAQHSTGIGQSSRACCRRCRGSADMHQADDSPSLAEVASPAHHAGAACHQPHLTAYLIAEHEEGKDTVGHAQQQALREGSRIPRRSAAARPGW